MHLLAFMMPLALRSILVATDLEMDMVPALLSAYELAELTGAELNVVHAGAAPAQRKSIDAKIAALAAALGRALDVSLIAGPPAAAITQEAARTDADVIVLGHHRNRAGVPGSTADRVVRIARVPCLILPVPLSLPITSVLVPVDIRYAEGPLGVALTWASALRRRAQSGNGTPTRVHVLYIHSDPNGDPRDIAARLLQEVSAIERQMGKLALVEIERHVERNEDVSASILRHAQMDDAALIVLGTRAKRIENEPLGSVSSAVTRQATRPVLLVPPEVWRPDVK